MAIARSMIEEIEENEEEKKESPSPQNNSCLFENNYNDLLEHSSEYLDLLIHESPAKAEIEQGIQILKTDELDTKKMQTIIFLAGEHAPLVADALKTLKNANALNHQYCMAVGKAGPSAPKVAAVLIQLSDMYLLYNRYMSDLYAHFLLLDTDEFIKLSDKIIHAINKMRLNAHKETFLDALHSLIIVKTLRLSECIIDAISVNLTSNTLFYDVVESSEGIADAILLLNKYQMLDQIDNIVKAGKRALKFAHILVNLKKAGLTLSKKLTNKGLIAIQNGYLADKIIGAFLDGERLDTFYQLFLLQKEFENGSLIMMFPEDIHELISSYFHSSDADCLKDKYALIRAGQNAETLKKSLECLYKIKKPTDNNRYVFEQIFHEIFAGSSINAKLFRHKPDLFVELISILEQQYEHHVIAMLLKQVPYNTLKQDNIRTAIADGLKALSTEGNLNGILKKVNQQTVVSAREHASEVAKALILLNKNGLLNTKHRAVLLNYANNAINVAKQIIHQKARPLSLMFRPHGARKRNHVETPTAPSKRARPSK